MAASRGNYFCRFLLLFVLLLLLLPGCLPAPTNNGKNKPKAPVKQCPRQESSHDKSSTPTATATEQIETRRAPRLKNKLIAMALGCWLCPSLGLRLVWAGKQKEFSNFHKMFFCVNKIKVKAEAANQQGRQSACRV